MQFAWQLPFAAMNARRACGSMVRFILFYKKFTL